MSHHHHHHELKEHEPWFEEDCSKLLDQREQAKLRWLQNSSYRNGDNLNDVIRESGRTSRNKKREYTRDTINELKIGSKNKHIRLIQRYK
jgi:SRSO17 transposase